jgi:uncharacterized protein involved in exopolysaccharide biosynthesis
MAVLCVGAFVLVVGALAVMAVPKQYRAEAAVKVIDARPPAEYVQPSFAVPAVTDIVGERMKALRLHILNRPLLVKVTHDTGLRDEFGGDEKRAMEALRDRFEFRVEGADTFTVSFTDRDAGRAEAVVNKLAQAFMEQENAEIQGRADATTTLLAESARNLRKSLDEADLKVADFKRKHYGALPEQQDENLRALDQTQMEVNILEQTVQTALDRRRHLLENDISPLRKAEDEMSGRLATARSQYTEDNPEVARLQAEYAKLRDARIVDEQKLRHETLTKNPEVLAVGTEIARVHGHLAELRRKQAILRSRVDQTAKNQQLLAAMNLDRDVTKDKYTSTQAKLREAETSASMAQGFRPYRFSVLEPAVQPTSAAAPNKPLLAVGVLLLAVLAALGTGLGLELVDPTVRDATDVEQMTPDIPVLVAIPRIDRRDPQSAPRRAS